jgi:hypothetical protein
MTGDGCIRSPSRTLLTGIMHPLIHAELGRANAADVDRLSREAHLPRPLSASRTRRRMWRRKQRRLVRSPQWSS